jgi:glutathione S-transferase
MFAALNTVEPPIVEREAASYMERVKRWHEHRLPIMEDRIRTRLDQLSARLGDAGWLDGEFSAGEEMMVSWMKNSILRYRLSAESHWESALICHYHLSVAELMKSACRTVRSNFISVFFGTEYGPIPTLRWKTIAVAY